MRMNSTVSTYISGLIFFSLALPVTTLMMVQEITPMAMPSEMLYAVGMARTVRKAGEYFITTGSGKFFRNVEPDPVHSIGIVEINEKGDSWRIVWGLLRRSSAKLRMLMAGSRNSMISVVVYKTDAKSDEAYIRLRLVKIQKISEIEPCLGFTEFDMLKKYRQSFVTAVLLGR